MATKVKARNIVSRDALDQITIASETELDNILLSLNSNDTLPLKFSVTGSDRVLSIGSIFVTNPETNKNKTIPIIATALPNFTSGTVTAPTTGSGNITVSSGSPLTISMSASQFLKIGISINAAGDIVLTAGTAAGTLAGATAPTPTTNTFSIGYIVLRTNGSNDMQNILNSDLYQYVGGSSAMTNPMTTGGDIIYGGTSGAPTRLANGSNGQVLTSSGGTAAPTWTTLSGTGDVVGPASAVNNNVVLFDGTTGKLIKDSGLTLSGSNTGDQTSVSGNSGSTDALKSSTTTINVSSATAPSNGQVLTATSSTTATWQTPGGGGGGTSGLETNFLLMGA